MQRTIVFIDYIRVRVDGCNEVFVDAKKQLSLSMLSRRITEERKFWISRLYRCSNSNNNNDNTR